jgi:hypothetical protein
MTATSGVIRLSLEQSDHDCGEARAVCDTIGIVHIGLDKVMSSLTKARRHSDAANVDFRC